MADQAIIAVLAGGRGERLGRDKAMAELAGRPLISHPLAAARGTGLETIVVAKRTTVLPPLSERVLHEPEGPRHPLCGVVAALELAGARKPAQAVLVIACDMPFLTTPLLSWLAALDGTAMVELDGRPQPMLSRCEPDQLPALRAALNEERPLRRAIEALAPQRIGEAELAPFGNPERLCFNVNDRADLALAERWIAEGS